MHLFQTGMRKGRLFLTFLGGGLFGHLKLQLSPLSSQVLFSKPNSFMNLQGMFYANTQRIFGVLRINRLTQHAFEAAPARGMLLISDVYRVLNREMLFPPNKLKLTLQRCRETTRVRNFLLFIWKLNHFCQS